MTRLQVGSLLGNTRSREGIPIDTNPTMVIPFLHLIVRRMTMPVQESTNGKFQLV